MFDQSALNRMTAEQRHHVSMLGVQARELKRLSQEPPAIIAFECKFLIEA